MTPEGKTKTAIRKYLKTVNNCYAFAPIGSAFGSSGVPDIIVCLNGRFVGIEVKAPGREKTLTALQEQAANAIEAAGGWWLLATSVEDVQRLVEGEED